MHIDYDGGTTVEITNPLLYSFYSIEAFLNLEIFIFFAIKWKKEKTERHISVIGLAYLLLAIARGFLILWDFFDAQATSIYYIFAAFFAFLAMTVFLFAAESYIAITRKVFTIAFMGLSGVILFLPVVLVRSFYYIFSPVMIVITIIFSCVLMANTMGTIRKKFFIVFLGLVFYGAGYALGAEMIKNMFVAPFRDVFCIFQTIIVLIGLSLTGAGYFGLPSLSEIHWQEYMLHVFVFHIETSVSIFDRCLLKKNLAPQKVKADLFSSGVSGVIGIVREMIQSEKRLKVLDHDDKKILLEYGDHVIVALVALKDLKIFREKLYSFIGKIESMFKDDFIRWTSEITKFEPGMVSFTESEFMNSYDPGWWRVMPCGKSSLRS